MVIVMNRPILPARHLNSASPVRAASKRRNGGFTAEFLDAETEARLARAWRDEGDTRARDRLILAHRALAYKAAARMTRGGGRPDEDLIQQANIGLLKAADRFDPDMGFRFSTYAAWWVRAEIQDYAYSDWSLIRMPGSSVLRRMFFGLRRAEAELKAEGVLPEDLDAAIAKRFDVDVERVQMVRDRLAARDLSLNQQMGDTEGSAEWQDLLADPDPLSDPETRVGEASEADAIAQLLGGHLARLPERDRRILAATVMQDDTRTLAEMGEEFQISRERVRQIRERALLALKRAVQGDEVTRKIVEDQGIEVVS